MTVGICCFAALFCVAAIAVPAMAIDADAYRGQIEKARADVAELLSYAAEAESGDPSPAEEHEVLVHLRTVLPETEAVESDGRSIEVSNRAIYERLALLESERDTTKRAIYLNEIDELLSAISTAISPGQAEADRVSKDEYKRKLAEILAREEYQKPAEKEGSGIAGLIERFLNWIRSFFPDAPTSNVAPFDFSGLATVLQVVLFLAIFGLLGFLVYKFAPLLFPSVRRRSGVKKSRRTILGETIAADETSADLFSEAERLARGGEIRAAIRKGYIALLCDLSDKNVISLEQHKTNRDYLREVRRRQALFGRVSGLTGSFERHWYGLQPTAEGDWESFRENYKKAVADA
jgi:hypothetical protein